MAEENELQNNAETEQVVQPEEQFDGLTEYEQSEQKKKKILYVVIFAIQVILAFVLIKFVVLPWYNVNDNEKHDEEVIEEPQKMEKKELGQIFTISDLTVNPRGSRGRRFAVFEIALSVPEVEMVDEIKKYETVIKDNYIQYFRSKTVEELSADSAMINIKSDLIEITENIVGPNKVNDIFFTRFILQ